MILSRTIDAPKRAERKDQCRKHLGKMVTDWSPLTDEDKIGFLQEWYENMAPDSYPHIKDVQHHWDDNFIRAVGIEHIRRQLVFQEICEEVAEEVGLIFPDMVFRKYQCTKENLIALLEKLESL